jgi:predicted TIM-barrel fold metal-dependent hydrolase
MITLDGEKIEVIDAHSHMGSRNKLAVHQIPRIRKFTAEEMMASMDEAGVDKVVTFAIGAGEPVDYRDTNSYIASSMKKYPDRIIGFMRLNPAKSPFEGVGGECEAGPQRSQDSPAHRKMSGERQRKSLPPNGGGRASRAPSVISLWLG